MISSGAQRVISQSADDVYLGVVDDAGHVRFYQAGGTGTGLPSGHADLVARGLVSRGSQGFSIHVSHGRVTTFVRNSALNSAANAYNLSESLSTRILRELPTVQNLTVLGN